MTASLESIANCPDWPRWLSREQAAQYVGRSVNQFMSEVDAGLWCKPKSSGRRVLFDRKLLDLASDRQSGIAGPEITGRPPELEVLARIG
jgi:hypothetical protein